MTTACEMSDEVDVLRRGAGTLLNTRLIPLIAEFFQAVKHVMEERNMKMPLAIMRSDGSLMSGGDGQGISCGDSAFRPAASLVGGSVLAGQADAVIVDMGGTTTDVAHGAGQNPPDLSGRDQDRTLEDHHQRRVRGHLPSGRGQRRPLPGAGALYLDGRRVIPLSFLADAVSGNGGKAGSPGQAEADPHPDAPRILRAAAEHRRTARSLQRRSRHLCRALEQGAPFP